MTIKKPMNVPESAEPLVIDRSVPGQNMRARNDSVATTSAVVAGLVALAVVGVLTFVIYQHWEFLQGA